MERCIITEEKVTKNIIKWLQKNEWHIVCFDFPQSWTGYILHSDNKWDSKNKNSFIPDIVAIKWDIVLFFENKDRFYLKDFYKVNELRNNDFYIESIKRLLKNFQYKNIFYWIWLPKSDKIKEKYNKYLKFVDFIIEYDWENIEIAYSLNNNII